MQNIVFAVPTRTFIFAIIMFFYGWLLFHTILSFNEIVQRIFYSYPYKVSRNILDSPTLIN